MHRLVVCSAHLSGVDHGLYAYVWSAAAAAATKTNLKGLIRWPPLSQSLVARLPSPAYVPVCLALHVWGQPQADEVCGGCICSENV